MESGKHVVSGEGMEVLCLFPIPCPMHFFHKENVSLS